MHYKTSYMPQFDGFYLAFLQVCVPTPATIIRNMSLFLDENTILNWNLEQLKKHVPFL
ncbi:hypothetical protein Fmac_004437 [Flemingia macrophylla]|uniref:Uncharacterized protein n=1 Tax=Flemingia macrophylla TaxID=520843 RepID=A0ABD1N4X1_9FABA